LFLSPAGCISSIGADLHRDPGRFSPSGDIAAMKIEGILRSGFVLMERVTVEVKLPDPDLTSHRDINRFMESQIGKWVVLQIEEVA
jgi:hypothetical protein